MDPLRIIHELSILILELGQMTVQYILSLMEVLNFQEGAPPVRPIILVPYNPCLQYVAKYLEVPHHILVFPNPWHLANKQAHIYLGTLDAALTQDGFLLHSLTGVLQLSHRFLIVGKVLQLAYLAGH
jgi:hypothetical protein